MFALPDLPFAYDALEPTMSAQTLHLHHDKHHKKYVDTVNELTKGKPAQSLEQVIEGAVKNGETKLFNNAAQAWNHAFFWNALTPKTSQPEGDLLAAIERSFGSVTALRDKFVKEGEAQFGSGWAWLVEQDGKLDVVTTHDAHAPMATPGVKPLLVCDVWEHAYYLDTKNDRKAFLEGFFDKLANWSFAAERLDRRRKTPGPIRPRVQRKQSEVPKEREGRGDVRILRPHRGASALEEPHASLGSGLSRGGAGRRLPRIWRSRGRRGGHRQDSVLRLPGPVRGLAHRWRIPRRQRLYSVACKRVASRGRFDLGAAPFFRTEHAFASHGRVCWVLDDADDRSASSGDDAQQQRVSSS